MASFGDITKPVADKAKIAINPTLPIPAFSDIAKAANDVCQPLDDWIGALKLTVDR